MPANALAEFHQPERHCDPHDREPSPLTQHEKEIREKMLDKTIADSFPTSDPPSSIPDPAAGDSMDPAA